MLFLPKWAQNAVIKFEVKFDSCWVAACLISNLFDNYVCQEIKSKKKKKKKKRKRKKKKKKDKNEEM